MNFERIFGANVNFGQPLDWDEEKQGKCETLPVRFNPDHGTCSSAWRPSPEELAALNAGGLVVLCVVGRQPPVSLHVETPDGDRR